MLKPKTRQSSNPNLYHITPSGLTARRGTNKKTKQMRKYGNRTIAIGPWLLTAGLVLAVGCTGVTPEQTAARHELMLKPSAVATKADPELAGTSLGTDNTYVVYLSASCDQQPQFMTGQLYSYISATTKWEASSGIGTANPLYWPLAEKLDFLGLACTPAAYTALTPAWHATTSANSVTITDWDTYAKQYDVMYAAANGQTSASNSGTVSLAFRHTMALVCFTAQASVAGAITINGITINDLEYEGTLTVDNTHTGLTATWSDFAAPANKLAYNLSGTTADYAYAVTTSAAQCCQHLLVPQQAAKSVTLTYTMKDAVNPLNIVVYLPRAIWKAGYKYTYALNFTPTEITATPSVSAWDGTPVEEDL